MDDLIAVVKYFEKEGYEIYTIIGHSRGTNHSEGWRISLCSWHSKPSIIQLIFGQLNHFLVRKQLAGANVMFHYAATHGRSVPHIVNISGRFYMINVKSRHDERTRELLETQVRNGEGFALDYCIIGHRGNSREPILYERISGLYRDTSIGQLEPMERRLR